MRIRLVVNPVASSMTARRRSIVEAALRTAHEVDSVTTAARGDARVFASDAAADGVDVVVVAAGDGTLNEAAGGLVGSTTALAPLPGGSTNVFARAVGYGNRIDRATDLLVGALARGSVARIGLGTANGRHFLFHLGTGFDAAVIRRIEQNPASTRIKRYTARPAFAVTTVRLLARGFDRRHPALQVEIPGRSPVSSFFTVVSNIAPYSYVGPRRMVLTRDAGFDRSLACTSLTRFDLGDVAAAFGSAVGGARHLQRSRYVEQTRDLTEVELTAAHPGARFPWQVDGDYIGTVESLSVRYEPDALSVVLPGI